MAGSTDVINESEKQASLYALQLSNISVFPMILKAAIELDLLELIAKAGPGSYLSASELATKLSAKNVDAPAMLDRVLRVLTSFSVLQSQDQAAGGGVERRYGLTPVGKYFLKNTHGGGTLAALVVMLHDKALVDSWRYFKDAILDGGIPFEKAHGIDMFNYMIKDTETMKHFHEGLYDYTTMVIKKILEVYDGFKGIQTLVDVGGGIGAVLNAIVSKYPTIKAINFDLPDVVNNFPPYTGLTYVGGDMFVNVPKGDAIFMKSVLHDWGDDKCELILKNCYESLGENGKVIIADYILPEEPKNSLESQDVFLGDMHMFAYNNGGKERTEKEFKSLAKKAGFKDFRKVCCAYTTWIMELRK